MAVTVGSHMNTTSSRRDFPDTSVYSISLNQQVHSWNMYRKCSEEAGETGRIKKFQMVPGAGLASALGRSRRDVARTNPNERRKTEPQTSQRLLQQRHGSHVGVTYEKQHQKWGGEIILD